jgi:hypothetical protein
LTLGGWMRPDFNVKGDRRVFSWRRVAARRPPFAMDWLFASHSSHHSIFPKNVKPLFYIFSRKGARKAKWGEHPPSARLPPSSRKWRDDGARRKAEMDLAWLQMRGRRVLPQIHTDQHRWRRLGSEYGAGGMAGEWSSGESVL